MEFVVHVLEKFFQKDVEAATKIMLHVHHHGIGECGVFTYEIAETKVTQVMDFARKHQHPLQCVMEKSDLARNPPKSERVLHQKIRCQNKKKPGRGGGERDRNSVPSGFLRGPGFTGWKLAVGA